MADKLEALFAADPQAAIALLKRLQPLVVKPHAGQREVIDDPARFKVLDAGRRWGKTKIGAKMMLDAARSKDNQLIWWVAPTYKVVKRGYRQVLRQIPKELLTHDPPPETNFDAGRSVILQLKNGSTIEFYSAERPGGMLGEGVDFAVLDEAATMPSAVWEQIVRPTMMDTGGKALLISTPRGRNWFYRRYLAGQDPNNPEWSSWKFPSHTNPYLEDGEIESIISELPQVLVDQEILAEFIAAGSNVFAVEPQVIQKAKILGNGLVQGAAPAGAVFLGIDLARTTDFTVLLGARESDGLNCFYKRFRDVRWSQQKAEIRRTVRTLLRNGAETVTLVVDETGVGSPIKEELEEDGYDVIGVNFTSLKAKMVGRFGNDLERGRALVLEERLEEFENYELHLTPKGVATFSAPEGENDDVVSAKILSHWGMMTEGAPGVFALSANSDPSDPQFSEADDDPGFDGDDWSDLLDPESAVDTGVAEVHGDLATGEVARDAPRRPLTPEEIFNRPDAWG